MDMFLNIEEISLENIKVSRAEVIGNIYENPELLAEERKND